MGRGRVVRAQIGLAHAVEGQSHLGIRGVGLVQKGLIGVDRRHPGAGHQINIAPLIEIKGHLPGDQFDQRLIGVAAGGVLGGGGLPALDGCGLVPGHGQGLPGQIVDLGAIAHVDAAGQDGVIGLDRVGVQVVIDIILGQILQQLHLGDPIRGCIRGGLIGGGGLGHIPQGGVRVTDLHLGDLGQIWSGGQKALERGQGLGIAAQIRQGLPAQEEGVRGIGVVVASAAPSASALNCSRAVRVPRSSPSCK